MREELPEGAGVEAVGVGQLQRRHHLVAGAGVGDGEHHRGDDTGEAGEDPLDGGGREVLPVDAQPVRRAPREVEEALLCRGSRGHPTRTSPRRVRSASASSLA